MRSLSTKLTLAFLLIGLTGAILVAVITTYRVRIAFNQFILNQEQEAIVNGLLLYYEINGSWDGVADNLEIVFRAPQPFQSAPRNYVRDWENFALVDEDHIVVFGSSSQRLGETVSEKVFRDAYPLVVDGQEVGRLVVNNPDRRVWNPATPEGTFLSRMISSTVLSALIAAGLALILGGLLAYRMTYSLRELTDATVEIAHGKLGKQVTVRSQDELGELAGSFNKMSNDLAKAVDSRRQMTADIAHDLRNPLSVISGYAEALSDGKLPGTPEVYEILNQETKHLARLVEDLRTLSLADAGELPLNLQPFDPRELLERVIARHSVSAQNKGISLKLEAAPGLPNVSIDIERMLQVFDNLITNAFRYTQKGGEIELGASQRNGSVVFIMRDNGSGILPADLPHIFDRFYKGDKSRQESGESGLGLAITKSIIDLHGGTISVKSEPGQGTEFTITLKALP